MPYETITKEQYESLPKNVKPFDQSLLRKYEFADVEDDLDADDACSSGICAIR